MTLYCEDCKHSKGSLRQGDLVLCGVCNEKRFQPKTPTPSLENHLQSMMNNSTGSTENLSTDIRDIKQSLEFICKALDTINKRDEQTQLQIKTLSAEVKSLKETVSNRDTAIQTLEGKVDDLEQIDRNKNLIINGIQLQTLSMIVAGQTPLEANVQASSKPEMVKNFITFARNDLEVKVEASDIADISVIREKNKDKPSRTTKITFSNQNKRKEVYAAKKNLFRKEIRNVFVNEDLTNKKFSLLMMARRAKKEKKVEFAWSYEGTVFVKTFGDIRNAAKTVVIREESDIRRATNHSK